MPHPPHLKLSVLPEPLTICHLDAASPTPTWATSGAFYSITRTPDELSIVCPTAALAPGVIAESEWRAFKIAGPLDFSLVGVLASIAAPLAEAQVSIFSISTYDTDYVLVRAADTERAVDALTSSGHHVD